MRMPDILAVRFSFASGRRLRRKRRGEPLAVPILSWNYPRHLSVLVVPLAPRFPIPPKSRWHYEASAVLSPAALLLA